MAHSTSGDDRLTATLTYVLSTCLPVAAPLLIFLVKRRSRFVAFHALQALFIELGLVLMGAVFFLVSGVLGLLGPLALLAAPLPLIAGCVGAIAWIYKIIGAIQASGGNWYRIPFVWPYAERIA